MKKVLETAAITFLAGIVVSAFAGSAFAGPAYSGGGAQGRAAATNSSSADTTPAAAEQETRPAILEQDLPPNHPVVTPYGDFCPRCSRYGVGTRPVVHAEAVAAMHAYFHAKGLSIGNVRNMGRFMIADVYQDGKLVDTVIFDRRTGRLRSIF